MFSNKRASRIAGCLWAFSLAMNLTAFADAANLQIKQLLDSGQNEKAIAAATAELSQDPQSFECYCQRALAHLQLKQYRESIDDYSSALAIKSDAAVRHNRGIAYYRMNDFAQAIQDFGTAIKINPSFAEAYCHRGQAYMALGKYESANRDFAQAIQIQSDYAEAHMMLGASYLALSVSNRQQAAKSFQRASQLDPHYGTTIETLCREADKANGTLLAGTATTATVAASRTNAVVAPVRSTAMLATGRAIAIVPSGKNGATPSGGKAQSTPSAETDVTSKSALVASAGTSNDRFAAVIADWLKVKQAAVKTKQVEVLSSVLGGQALARQTNAIKWLSENHKYYDLNPKQIVLDQVKEITPGRKYRVLAQVHESYRLIDEHSGRVVKQVDDINHVNYTIENAGGRWLITDSAVTATLHG